MYLEMAKVLQIYNVFRNRWCGAYWASKGLRVIPTVNWGDESTFDFCFEGIEKGSTVAVSTYMAAEHGNHSDQKDWFMPGYNEILRRIEPETIICYHTPFPEMQGNLVCVDYERSSWKYMSYQPGPQKIDLSAYKIGGTYRPECDIMKPYRDIPITRGGGSAYGGKWKPKKAEDERLIGEPGNTNKTYDSKGNLQETKIGEDGFATKERHHSDHGYPDKHSVPHDHEVSWGGNHPNWSPPQNYWDGDIPEFKTFRRNDIMASHIIGRNSFEDNRFKTISEFIFSLNCGAEIEFEWKGQHFGVFPKLRQTPDSPLQMLISQVRVDDPAATEQWYDTADELLEYIVCGDRLRDVITQVKVWDRTI